MNATEIISPDYLAQQKELHKLENYGVASIGFMPLVRELLERFDAKSLCDYGAGKQNLKKALHAAGKDDFEYHPYDPVFPEYGPPRPADLVCCIDVLEHIELDFLENVLADLRAVTQRIGFFSIATGPAKKILSDGRNAHLIQEPAAWWLPRLENYFKILRQQDISNGFWVLVAPR